jgi:hypothetical protein
MRAVAAATYSSDHTTGNTTAGGANAGFLDFQASDFLMGLVAEMMMGGVIVSNQIRDIPIARWAVVLIIFFFF